MKKSVYLKDEHWEIIKPYIKEPKPREDRRGRERRDPREVLEGILWVLKTGARWRDLPRPQYPPYQTCHRRFQEWIKNGSIYDLLKGLARILNDAGIIKMGESFIDGSFASAKKGVSKSGKPRKARVQR